MFACYICAMENKPARHKKVALYPSAKKLHAAAAARNRDKARRRQP